MPVPIAPIISAGASLLGNVFGAAGTEYSNRKAFERMRQHDIEMFNLQKQDRDEQNRYNAPAAQVARLAAAGINPASVFGSGTSVAESAPVAGSAGATASGTDWSITGRMAQDALIPLQMEQARANIELTNANKANVEAKTAETAENTKWIEAKAKADIDSKNASARLDRGRYDLLSTEKDEKIASIEKMRREADTEIEKQFYYESQRMLIGASIREINALLPYKQLLMSAQTENQKQQASLAMMNALYQKGLLDEGYIDKLCDKVLADTRQSNAAAAGDELKNFRSDFKNAILTGEGFDGFSGFLKNAVYSAGLLVGSFIPGASNAWID